MRYLLNKDYRLRGWKDAPCYLEYFPSRELMCLSPEDFLFLLRCDGTIEQEYNEWKQFIDRFTSNNIIRALDEGEEAGLSPEQEYMKYSNRKFHYVDVSLTGRCNMNCKHCFNAPDVNPRIVEPSMDKLKELLKGLNDCGVGRLRLVGGEPLVRKDFLEFTEEMTKYGIRLYDIATNGWNVNEELLDALEAQGHHPIWLVSFDGVGFHDWLRGAKGAEEHTLDVMKLLCDRGYYVQAHQCVWKDSIECIRPTVLKLKELGVSRYRITPVEPSLRWKELAPEQSLSIAKWQAYISELLEWWYSENIGMDIDIWGYWQHEAGNIPRIVFDLCEAGACQDKVPVCGDARSMPYIDADGRLAFCVGISGGSKPLGIQWDNVYEKDIRELFTDSLFTERLGCSCAELKERNGECHECEWRDRCSMGCRAEALTQGNGIFGRDERTCAFFKNGLYKKLLDIKETVCSEHK